VNHFRRAQESHGPGCKNEGRRGRRRRKEDERERGSCMGGWQSMASTFGVLS
jgi:hypothetical protein